jgi:hypothetical protein
MYKLRLGRYADAMTIWKIKPEIKDVNLRFRHTYLVGSPGTGKSNLLTQMAVYDLLDQEMAGVVICPKGAITRDLHYMAKDLSRIVNLSFGNPFVINPLRKKGYAEPDMTQEFCDALRILIKHTVDNPVHVTVLMEELIKEAVKVIPEGQRNADYLFKFFSNSRSRGEHFHKYGNRTEYWEFFDGKEGRSKRESALNVASRLHFFQDDPRLKRICCGENQFNVREFIKEKKILLVDTSGMSVQSQIYVSSLVMCAIASYIRFEMKSWDSSDFPFMVFVDEFHTCITETFPDIMEFCRGYRIGFNLSHQNFAQIENSLLERILPVCNTFMCFRTFDREAKRMAGVYGIDPNQILSLPDYQAWLRVKEEKLPFETVEKPEVPKYFRVPVSHSPVPDPQPVKMDAESSFDTFLRPGGFVV